MSNGISGIVISTTKHHSVCFVTLTMELNEDAPNELLSIFKNYSEEVENITRKREVYFKQFENEFLGTEKTYNGIISKNKINQLTQFLK